MLKRKKGKFDPSNLACFSGEDGLDAFNDWIRKHGRKKRTRYLLQLHLL